MNGLIRVNSYREGDNFSLWCVVFIIGNRKRGFPLFGGEGPNHYFSLMIHGFRDRAEGVRG